MTLPANIDHLRRAVERRGQRGLTLIEVLITIALLGFLVSLAAPAVQAARESARATQCRDNLRNQGQALLQYHSAHGSLPAGNDALSGTQQAWSSRIVPFLEGNAIARTIDYSQPWNAAGPNVVAAAMTLAVYQCPSAVTAFAGKQDYGGVMGTSLEDLPTGQGPFQAFGCGALITTNAAQPSPVSAKQITDGLSHTLLTGESVDRPNLAAANWACGLNCFAQNLPFVNMDDIDGLNSPHPAGAYGLFADGHVRLLDDDLDSSLLAAVCTRNGTEVDADLREP
jgi:prepilin-type N-terminal cleavage/methylation domain-containing protein/prepilin-type processing-associated H-X9-DG protein